MKAIETPHRLNTLLVLDTDGAKKHVLFKDWAVDPVSRKLLHADFLEVKLDQPVKVRVPVVTTGKAEGVAQGGILSIAAHDIDVEALPAKIPVNIEVDVTTVKIGQSLHIAELKAPEGCKFKYTTNYVVVFVAVPEKEEVVAVVAAVPGAVPAEGAAGAVPGAPGAVPGAPGAVPGAAPAAGAAAPAAGAAPAKGAAPAGKGGKGKK
jgi:large subunit ribosomal protein L25